MQERFSPQQIAKLRDEYGKISTIDPSGQAYKQLVAMLDRLELDDLKTLAGAKIKFVSGLAQNRVNRAKSKNEEVNLNEYKQFMKKDMDDLARVGFRDAELALSKFEPVTSSAGKRAFKGFQVTHEIRVGGNYGPAYDLTVLKKGEKYYGAFGPKIAGNEFNSPEDAANWTLKMYNWMRKSANAAEYLSDRVTFIKEEVELDEMDKTQTSPGRDGDIDWTKKQIHLGPEHMMKSKDISKHGLKILDKMMKKSQKKTVKEDTDLEEGKSGTGYELYHKDFSSAMAHAYDFAKKKYNIEIDPLEIDRNVAMGPKKPSSGKANSYRLLDKTGKKAIQVQVTNLDNKRYELNMYKEDIDEASSPAQQAAIAIAMKKAGKKPKDMEEAVGGGTSVNTQSLKSAEAQKKRADVAVKIAALKLKQQKEREALQKQKRSVKEEVMDVVEVEINEADKVPEYKTGGEPLAKKFEKAFAKMGIKTNIKMKTVGNVSVNEAAMKKVLSANKKKKMKEQEEAPSKKDNMKSGDALSGKREPIEINPEIENKK